MQWRHRGDGENNIMAAAIRLVMQWRQWPISNLEMNGWQAAREAGISESRRHQKKMAASAALAPAENQPGNGGRKREKPAKSR